LNSLPPSLPLLPPPCFWFLFFETRSHYVIQADCKLEILLRLPLSAGIIAVFYHTWLLFLFLFVVEALNFSTSISNIVNVDRLIHFWSQWFFICKGVLETLAPPTHSVSAPFSLLLTGRFPERWLLPHW
jgi:hypothetical protein